jgi:hypothetical protein
MAEEIINNPDRNEFARRNRDALYRLISGGNPADLAEQVRILGGTRAAAEAAGVTQRTVQRWITKTGTQKIRHPGADARGRVNAAAAQTHPDATPRRTNAGISEGRAGNSRRRARLPQAAPVRSRRRR